MLGFVVGCASTSSLEAVDYGEDVPLSQAMLSSYAAEQSHDPTEAVPLWEYGCKNGDLMGCARLGMALRTGYGAPRDLSRAGPLLSRACRGNIGAACTELGLINGDESLHARGCALGDPFGCSYPALLKGPEPAVLSKADPETMRIAASVVQGLRGRSLTNTVEEKSCTQETMDAMSGPGWEEELGIWQDMMRAAQLSTSEYDVLKEEYSFPLGAYRENVVTLCWEKNGKRRSRGEMQLVIVHELVHALDDDLFDFKAMRNEPKGLGNSDRELAIKSLIEGSARSTEREFYSLAAGTGRVHSGELNRRYKEEEKKAEDRKIPPAFWASSSSYYYGMRFLARGSLRSRWAEGNGRFRVDAKDVERAFTHPPWSMEQVLHPFKYWSDAGKDEPMSIVVEPFVRALSAMGWKVVAHDTFGELIFRLLVEPSALEKPAEAVYGYGKNVAAAEGWDGDRFFLLQKSGVSAGLLISTWDTLDDRRQFREAVEKSGRKVVAVDVGQRSLGIMFGVPPKHQKPLHAWLVSQKERRLLRPVSSGGRP